jgi:abortive infection bacteriophage resistance protein
MKTLKSTQELIDIMKYNGIEFNIVNEESAFQFMETSNYYMKLSSYRKNYIKYIDSNGKQYYQSLEFAYLQDLSRIDMYLRHLILKMCLDIEHSIKTKILNFISKGDEDGYSIVKRFLDEKDPKDVIKNSINIHSSSDYCKDLIRKYNNQYPLWVFFEVISFGDLCKFYKYFCTELYPGEFKHSDLLFQVRSLRNAAAHNNCLINNLYQKSDISIVKATISQYVQNVDGITKSQRKVRLKNFFICDFISLLYYFNYIVESNAVKKYRYEELTELIDVRMIKNSDYYTSNDAVKNSYKFCKIIVDNMKSNAYTNSTKLKNQ